MYIIVNIGCKTFCNLDNRSKAFYQIYTGHGNWHLTCSFKLARIPTSSEISFICWTELCIFQTSVNILIGYFPEWFHYTVPIRIKMLSGCIKGGYAGIQEVNDSVLCNPG